ncbi:hypothetical protein [Streptomyces collinus]
MNVRPSRALPLVVIVVVAHALGVLDVVEAMVAALPLAACRDDESK